MTTSERARDLLPYPLISSRNRLEIGYGEAVMTATIEETPSTQSPSENWVSRVLVPEMWATVAIVVMWMAVLFVGVYGGDMTFHGADTSWSNIPSGVAVALFAAIGTGSVAKRVFGRKSA